MKFILSILLLAALSPANADMLSDSIKVSFIFNEDRKLDLQNQLLNIEMLTLSIKDKKAKGKKILIYMDEYKEGKLIEHSDFGLSNRPLVYNMVVGGDTIRREINMADKLIFENDLKTYEIEFAGKRENDTLNLLIALPAMSTGKELASPHRNYQLRYVMPCTGKDEFTNVALGKAKPVITYAPPVVSGGLGDYCVLGLEKPENWYSRFGLQHYYVFYIRIE